MRSLFIILSREMLNPCNPRKMILLSRRVKQKISTKSQNTSSIQLNASWCIRGSMPGEEDAYSHYKTMDCLHDCTNPLTIAQSGFVAE